jgi:hypothetical protein
VSGRRKFWKPGLYFTLARGAQIRGLFRFSVKKKKKLELFYGFPRAKKMRKMPPAKRKRFRPQRVGYGTSRGCAVWWQYGEHHR